MKKMITALLLCAMLLSTLAACGSSGTPAAATTSANGEQTTSAAADETVTEGETTRAPLSVPVNDYDGYTFRVLGYEKGDTGTWGQYLDFGWSQDDAGELINDAIYTRNLGVEERYNIKIETIQAKDVYTTARKTLSAGSDEFDILEPYIDNAFTLAQEGLLLDFNNIPYVDITADWWDQAIIRDLSLCGKMYVMTGDISVYDEELNYGVYYNKAVAEQYSIPDCYQLARDGAWTIDKMTEYGHEVTHDVNGDGVLGEDDCYGVLTDYGVASVWFFAFGGKMAQLDDTGKPQLMMGDEKTANIMEKLSTFLTDKNLTLNASETKGQWKGFDTMLVSDRALFRPGSIYDVPLYRSMVSDFGILPYPKLDEAQDQYYHLIATWVCPGVCVPVTGANTERTGIILEALAYASKDTVTKAYYDVNLYTKVARDDESGDMLDIIFGTKRYDLAKTFGWGGLDVVVQSGAKDSGKFASLYAKAESKAQAQLDESYDFFNIG